MAEWIAGIWGIMGPVPDSDAHVAGQIDVGDQGKAVLLEKRESPLVIPGMPAPRVLKTLVKFLAAVM
jgi:hypothetical protein